MATLAPAAITAAWGIFKAAHPSAQLGGIVGDADHGRSGYHISRQDCYAGDYSVVMADDKLGPSNLASALDITLSAADMRKFSARLMALCKANDPRVYALREWFGTVDGVRVTGWDRHNRTNVADDTYTSSDDSHLWHIHLSGYRRYATDAAAWASIIHAMLGDDEPVTPAEIDAIAKAVWQYPLPASAAKGAPQHYTGTYLVWAERAAENSRDKVDAVAQVLSTPKTGVLARVATLQASVESLAQTVAAITPGAQVVVDTAKIAVAVSDAVVAKIKALSWKVGA